MIFKVKFFRVGILYPISMNGFGNLTDVGTGFRMCLTNPAPEGRCLEGHLWLLSTNRPFPARCPSVFIPGI